jgi:hypothetical protein
LCYFSEKGGTVLVLPESLLFLDKKSLIAHSRLRKSFVSCPSDKLL